MGIWLAGFGFVVVVVALLCECILGIVLKQCKHMSMT